MPDIKRLLELIDRLTTMSAENKVPWTETSDEKTFQATLNLYTVTVACEYAGQNWGEDVYIHVIRIHDAVGKLLDSATERDFSGMHLRRGVLAEEALRDLYDNARRKALKVDEALDDLLGSLGNL